MPYSMPALNDFGTTERSEETTVCPICKDGYEKRLTTKDSLVMSNEGRQDRACVTPHVNDDGTPFLEVFFHVDEREGSEA